MIFRCSATLLSGFRMAATAGIYWISNKELTALDDRIIALYPWIPRF